jgi:hypothetical protein
MPVIRAPWPIGVDPVFGEETIGYTEDVGAGEVDLAAEFRD